MLDFLQAEPFESEVCYFAIKYYPGWLSLYTSLASVSRQIRHASLSVGGNLSLTLKKKTLDNTLILLIWLASYNFVAWHTVVLWTISTCLTEWHTGRSVFSLVLGAITLTPPALWSPPANLDANGDLQGRDRMESEASHISHLTPSHEPFTLNTVTR